MKKIQKFFHQFAFLFFISFALAPAEGCKAWTEGSYVSEPGEPGPQIDGLDREDREKLWFLFGIMALMFGILILLATMTPPDNHR